MTTFVTVLTKTTDEPDVFKVFWACGRNTQGTVVVSIKDQLESKDVAAELSALQYILETLEVCGKGRAGNAMTITVSFGAIRKLAQGKSEKDVLAQYALFLRTRFADAEIHTDKGESFILTNKAASNTKRITIDSPILSALTFADGFQAGVTYHALSAYMVRYQVTVAANAWRALRAAIECPTTRLQGSTPEEQSRHGKEVLTYATPEGLRLIIVKDYHGAKIVTCYYSFSLDRSKKWAA